MKNSSIFYIAPKVEIESLEKVRVNPGETVHVTRTFIANLTDNQFKKFVTFPQDFNVKPETKNLIHFRMEQLGLRYEIDHKNKSIKT